MDHQRTFSQKGFSGASFQCLFLYETCLSGTGTDIHIRCTAKLSPRWYASSLPREKSRSHMPGMNKLDVTVGQKVYGLAYGVDRGLFVYFQQNMFPSLRPHTSNLWRRTGFANVQLLARTRSLKGIHGGANRQPRRRIMSRISAICNQLPCLAF